MKLKLKEYYKTLTSKQFYFGGKRILSLTIKNKVRTKVLHL